MKLHEASLCRFDKYAYYQYTCQVAIDGELMTDNSDKPGHLARRFQQIAVAVFHAAVEGRQTLDGIEPSVEAAQRIILGGLSTAEAATFMRLLRKVIATGNELSRAPQQPALAE